MPIDERKRLQMGDSAVKDNTCNHQCSRCGECCGLFIPFTDKELTLIKHYVREHNIQQVNRYDIAGGFRAQCCFFDNKNHKCLIYEVRPYACKDFKCDRKDWKRYRDIYEKRAKYNSTLNKKMIIATFDDKVFDDYTPIMQYIINMFCRTDSGYDSDILVAMLKHLNRLDILEHISVVDNNGKKIPGSNLIK